MPDLDVSDILLDPDFCEQVTVTRRGQAIGSDGVNVPVNQNLTITAVVTIGGLNLQIEQDAELSKNLITLHTQTRLFDATRQPLLDQPRIPPLDNGLVLDVDGYSPDLVLWCGNTYIVKKLQRWSHFGAGFFAIECELQDTQTSATS